MSRTVAALVYSKTVGSLLRKAVLAYCAERAHDDGSSIYPSKARIAKEVECSLRAVKNTVNEFLEEGFLRKVGHRPTSNGYVVEYKIDLGRLSDLPDAVPKKGGHLVPVSGESTAPDSGSRDPQPVQDIPPNLNGTIKEPFIEPSSKALDAQVDYGARSERLTITGKSRLVIELPDNWIPSALNRQDAIHLGFTEKEIDFETDQFRDHHVAKGSSLKDWDAAWRNWLRLSRKFAASGTSVAASTSRSGRTMSVETQGNIAGDQAWPSQISERARGNIFNEFATILGRGETDYIALNKLDRGLVARLLEGVHGGSISHEEAAAEMKSVES